MPCYHPLPAWQLGDGRITFRETADSRRSLQLPCGQCIGCRLKRARAWAIRCMHEAQMHQVNAFLTLTYDNDHVSPSLTYTDFQSFIRHLRRRLGPARFFVAGEYGETKLRPHWHCLLFGHAFTRDYPVKKGLWGNHELDKIWGNGYVSHGDVTPESTAYVAKYATAKITGPLAASHYLRTDPATGEVLQVTPEFGRMSLKPGIGYTWFQKYWREIYEARDGVVYKGGFTVPPPRYYDDLLMRIDTDLREWKDYERYAKSKEFKEDTTPERLKIREKVTQARIEHYRKGKL